MLEKFIKIQIIANQFRIFLWRISINFPIIRNRSFHNICVVSSMQIVKRSAIVLMIFYTMKLQGTKTQLLSLFHIFKIITQSIYIFSKQPLAQLSIFLRNILQLSNKQLESFSSKHFSWFVLEEFMNILEKQIILLKSFNETRKDGELICLFFFNYPETSQQFFRFLPGNFHHTQARSSAS